jgi:hypothetical protein
MEDGQETKSVPASEIRYSGSSSGSSARVTTMASLWRLIGSVEGESGQRAYFGVAGVASACRGQR